MLDPELERATQFLATHALLLLGVGMLAAAASIGAIVGAAHLAARLGPGVRHRVATLGNRVQEIPVLHGLIRQAHGFVPSAYLTLHLALGFVIAGALAVFTTVAEEALAGGELAAFDLAFARALHETRSPAWHQAFSVVSWFGTRQALAIATVAVTAALLWRQQLLSAFGFVTSQAGGGLLNWVLKTTFERTRPEFAEPLLAASSWSFPSGHAMGTFILCGMVCYLLVRENRSWTTAAVIVTAAAAWCVVMAFSRLYLGVHYASDVIAGLVAGVAWVATCVSALEVLQRRTGGARPG